MCEKLLQDLNSFNRFDRCKNNLCFDPERKSKGTTILFPVVDDNIDLQQELEIFFMPLTKLCVSTNCNQEREETIKATNHIIVELSSLPKGKSLTKN